MENIRWNYIAILTHPIILLEHFTDQHIFGSIYSRIKTKKSKLWKGTYDQVLYNEENLFKNVLTPGNNLLIKYLFKKYFCAVSLFIPLRRYESHKILVWETVPCPTTDI